MDLDLEIVLRLVAATFAGSAIGFERDVRGRPAGLRTHAMVALGAALFTIVGAYGLDGIADGPDPSRMAAQVVSGLGFIGGGAILRGSGGGVQGLTTAATIWIAGAMGVAYSIGLYLFATTALVLIMVILLAFGPLHRLTDRIGRQLLVIRVDYELGHGTLAAVLQGVERTGARPEHIEFEDNEDGMGGSTRTVQIEVLSERMAAGALQGLMAMLESRDEVREATVTRPTGMA